MLDKDKSSEIKSEKGYGMKKKEKQGPNESKPVTKKSVGPTYIK